MYLGDNTTPAEVGITPLDSVEEQASKIQSEYRRLISLAAQCPQVDSSTLRGMVQELSSVGDLLCVLSAIKEGKQGVGAFSRSLSGLAGGVGFERSH